MDVRKASAIVFALLMTVIPLARAAGPAPAPQADKKKAYDEEYDKAHTLLRRHEFFEALKGFQKANQLAGGRSAACFVGMAQAMVGIERLRVSGAGYHESEALADAIEQQLRK
jgi:hypothetical protein